jgi:predicted RNase H-like HicB family nuclease
MIERNTMQLTIDVHPEDGAFWAEVEELPGCFASGDNLKELFEAIGEGIELYLASNEAGAGRRRPSARILSS